jgi:hypothetical protein
MQALRGTTMTDTARIKELLSEWAGWHLDGFGTGYPKQVAFATERVQTSNRSTETFREIPPIISRLNTEIELMAPLSKRIIRVMFLEKGPQKLKANHLEMSREEFNRRLNFIYEHLHYRVIDAC